MEQWELERLRKRYEKRLNDTLRMAPHEDNVQDACDFVCQYALYEAFTETLPVSVVDVRTFSKKFSVYELLYSGRPDELILESDFDYFSSVPSRGVRGIVEIKHLIENPNSFTGGHGYGRLISLVNSGYLRRKDLIRIGECPRDTKIFYPGGISITVTSDKRDSMEISYGNRKKQAVKLDQLDGYRLDSYLRPGLDCVLWTNGLCWKIFYKGKLWRKIVLYPRKAYVKTERPSGRPLKKDMPIQIRRREFNRLVGILKSMYHKL